MENINEKEFSMEKFNDIMTKIKAGSPVHKINFSIENMNAVAGMYLISEKNMIDRIDNIADYADLNDTTLLVFESRHVIECCQIIYGCLTVLDGLDVFKFTYNYIIDKIIEALLTRPITRYKLNEYMGEIATSSFKSFDNKNASELFENFKYLMRNIWFVPYSEIDNIANEAIEKFKKDCGVNI